jgi:predicted nucleic acid-binding protein
MPLFAVDATIFSNFAHTERPQLLQGILQGQAIATAKVMAELQRGEELGLVPRCDWGWVELAVLQPTEVSLSEEIGRIVHPAEAECLAVAIVRGAVFLSDDFAARRLAVARGVVVSGTLGVLRGLIEGGSVTLAEADGFLRAMIEHGYRSPVRSLKELFQ